MRHCLLGSDIPGELNKGVITMVSWSEARLCLLLLLKVRHWSWAGGLDADCKDCNDRPMIRTRLHSPQVGDGIVSDAMYLAPLRTDNDWLWRFGRWREEGFVWLMDDDPGLCRRGEIDWIVGVREEG